MKTIAKLFSAEYGTKARSIIRAIVLVSTAFGLSLNAEQVAGIMLLAEAIFTAGVASPIGG